MDFLKIVLMTILVIGMVASVIFGVIDIVKLVVDLGETSVNIVEDIVDDNKDANNMAEAVNTVKDKTMLEKWHEGLNGIVMSGIGLAVTFMGWKSVEEYYEKKNTKVYRRSTALD